MKQLVLPVGLTDGQRITLSGNDFHYLAHVLRVRQGARLRVIDRDGIRHEVAVASINVDSVILRQLKQLEDDPDSVSIHVYQAVPKGRRFDDIVRNLTQLGVQSITPIVTRHSVADPTGKTDVKTVRWSRVAREAVQQSGAAPVVVHPPQRLPDVDLGSSSLSLLLHPEPLADTSLHGYLAEAPKEISLWVGPEGGFADNEIKWLREHAAAPLWLGPRVFRSELAAVVAVAAIQNLLLEQSAWRPTT